MSQILVTGATGFIGKYLLAALNRAGYDNNSITTLGRSADNTLVADLSDGPVTLTEHYDTVYHLAGSCDERSDHRRLNATLTHNLIASLRDNPPASIVYLSSVEVYGRTEGENWSEADIVDPGSPVGYSKLAAEEALVEMAKETGTRLTILRLPPVIGTGMTGPMMSMAKRIYRGTYHHIGGNEARVSVVHAVDVARAAVELSTVGGTFNLTDGINPPLCQLAEAIASRLNNKRIMTLRPKRAKMWARINDFIPGAWFDSRELKRMTTTVTYSADKAASLLSQPPTSVVEYLTTHNYEDDPF